MAVYDGFFDAVIDEDTGEYDRSYGSGDFTGYFDKIVGTGVCIHNDPDSFKVRFEGGAAVVSPGYLFIQGYWLRNDADYTIPVTGADTLAIVAHLNLGKRMIELEAVSVAQAYPDSLVLALVNPAAGTAEDTRHNTDLCNTIDTAGELSKKVEWAINYIDNEIEGKLAAAEAEIAEQSKRLDAKIAEVQAQVDKITPPVVGTIKFSASQDIGPDWLPCNGDFISESQYPELVSALGKLTPSGDKFQVLSEGEIGMQISNGALYAGRMWVYSYATKKLYGVDVEGKEPVKEVKLTSDSEYFGNFNPPSTAYPVCLSIVPHKVGTGAKLFLSQIVGGQIPKENTDYQWTESFLLFAAEFTGDEQSLELEPPFAKIKFSSEFSSTSYIQSAGERCIPYVVSKMDSGTEVYYCATFYISSVYLLNFDFSGDARVGDAVRITNNSTGINNKQRLAFSQKNNMEVVGIWAENRSSSGINYWVDSKTSGMFDFKGSIYESISISNRESYGPLNVVGVNKILTAFDLQKLLWFSIAESKIAQVDPQITLPRAARVFVDGGAYLWGKDIYLVFVGTGIIFSRTLEEGSFGYLDTTDVLGTITQFGYLDYSQDEGTLYIVGQDTANRVKVAKIVLNTLYDYANDGAWLPVVAADGVPAYIKARGEKVIDDPVEINVTVSMDNIFNEYAYVTFEGESLIAGTYTRTASESGTFEVGIRIKKKMLESLSYRLCLTMDGSKIISEFYGDVGETTTLSFKTSDYLQSGVTLKGSRL